jgi:Fusaric acid resistance protein-like
MPASRTGRRRYRAGVTVRDALRRLAGSAAELARVGPAPGSGWVGLRAAVTMLVALLVLWWFGALDHAAYATFGAFASVYGGAVRSARRWRLQAVTGGLLTLAVVCGAAVGVSDGRSWLAIPIAAAWAAAAAALSDRFRWRPPGPMFLVFAVATCAAIPTEPWTVATALLVAAGTAAFAVGLGALEVGMGRAGRIPDPGPPPLHPVSRQRVQAVRCAVAVVLAGTISTATGLDHPYWAMIAAVVPLAAPALRPQVVRGVHRLVGTMVGLGLAGLLLLAPLPVPAVIVLVAALQGATELLVARNYGVALVFITPLALLVVALADPVPVGPLLVSRLIETAIGVAVGVATAVVTRKRSRPG